MNIIDNFARLWDATAQLPVKRLRFYLKIHIAAYVVLLILFFWLAPFNLESSLYFWLPFIWGIALAIHFFIVSTMTVTDSWVDERSRDLQLKSYDFDHIQNIQQRQDNRDDSIIAPLDPRRRTKPKTIANQDAEKGQHNKDD